MILTFRVVPSGSRAPKIQEPECLACKAGAPFAPTRSEAVALDRLCVLIYELTQLRGLKARIVPLQGGPRLVVYAPDRFHRFYGAEGYTPLQLVKTGVSLQQFDGEPHPFIVPARIPLKIAFREVP